MADSAEDLGLLRNIGRNAGRDLLRSAVESAENMDQMNNQVYIARWAAIHILATEAYNAEEQMKVSRKEFLAKRMADIQSDIKLLSEIEMGLHIHKGTAEA